LPTAAAAPRWPRTLPRIGPTAGTADTVNLRSIEGNGTAGLPESSRRAPEGTEA
jgi:hypothetical protein